MEDSPLSTAIRAGDIDKTTILLDTGADIRYRREGGYDALVDAAIGCDRQRLIPMLRLLIARGAPLNGESDYAESALSVCSRKGFWDAIALLVEAGADAKHLQWTGLMFAIALGSFENVAEQIETGADLSARDFWSRTPWLLSLQVGDISKARLVLEAGADRSDIGRCGKPPLTYPLINNHPEMLKWLISLGLDLNQTDQFGGTALMEAADFGATKCAQILVDAGADIWRVQYGELAITKATNLEVVRLLVKNGNDLGDMSDEMRAKLTKLGVDDKIYASIEQYRQSKSRRFGASNPQQMDIAFWRSMIISGATAYSARQQFGDLDLQDELVWSFKRYGKSITELPDGRIIEIAGEHEDSYDPDFCIYNDVIVHDGDGGFKIYGYPEDCFPPTDFHTATLVGNQIYVIGNLGYYGKRKSGHTQVFRLNTDSLTMEELVTTGELPGWISEHRAHLKSSSEIQVSGGKVCSTVAGFEKYFDNSSVCVLDLQHLTWSKSK